MAELNFGLLTPPGSQSIGNAFAQGMDQAAVARAQENQNALSQYTLSKAKREDELTNKMLAGLQGATTIEQQAAVLRSVGKVKEANDLFTSDLERQYKLGQIKAQPGDREKTELGNREARAKFFLARLPALSQNPDDAAIGRYLKEAVDAGFMSFEEASAKSADLLRKSLPERKLQMLQGGQSAKDALAALKPDIKEFSGGLYNVNEVDPNTGMPRYLSPRVAPLSTDAANRQANVAEATAQDRGVVVPGVAPAQPGTPVTPATFPFITSQVQTQRNNEQIALLNAELAKSNPADQQRIRAEIAKLSTGDPFAKAGANPLPVVNNMPGAAAPAVNAMNAPSPREIREARAKGYSFNSDGTMSRISGGPADKTVVTRTPVQEVRFRKDLATDYSTTTATTQGMQDVLDSITDVKNSPGLAGATGIAGMVYSFPGSQAAAAETNLTNLKGKVTSLGQTLANYSGKIGPMAVQEWTIVRDMVAALDKAVSKGEKITLDELGKIEFAAKNVATRVQDKFEGQYGDELSNYPQFATVPEPKSRLSGKIKPAGGGSVTAPKTPTVNIDALLKKYE